MMNKSEFFNTDIKYIKGVGPAKAALLEKLNIKCVKDIVENYPRVYEDRTRLYKINELDKIQGIYPIYNLTAGITQNYMFKVTNEVFSNLPTVTETFDEEFRKKYNLAEINYAIKNVHFPESFRDINIARNRLIFEELFLFELALLSMKNNNIVQKKTIKFNKVDISEFLKLLPFELTQAQKRVVGEIEKDIYSDRVMNRMIQGDVGSGKTMVAAISMYIAIKNG